MSHQMQDHETTGKEVKLQFNYCNFFTVYIKTFRLPHFNTFRNCCGTLKNVPYDLRIILLDSHFGEDNHPPPA